VCVNCGATDVVPGGWGQLAEPCPSADTLIATIKLFRRPDGGFRTWSHDLPGLILSSSDMKAVSSAIIPSAMALYERRSEFWTVDDQVSGDDGEYIATVVLYRRPDDGFRVKSPELPGFLMSGLDVDAMSREIIPAVLSLSMKQNRKEP
jgi:hypothetical protein